MAKLPESLSNLLKAESEAVRSQTVAGLKLHDETLKQLSAAAQNIFVSASVKAVQALEKPHADLLQKVMDQGQDLVQELESQGRKAVKRIRWLMLWPLIGVTCTLIVVLIFGTVWSWLKVSQSDMQIQQKQMEVQQLEARIKSMTAAFCATAAGKQNCQ